MRSREETRFRVRSRVYLRVAVPTRRKRDAIRSDEGIPQGPSSMTRTDHTNRHAAILVIGALLLAGGCSENATLPPTQPDPLAGMPAASSAAGVTNAFLWCNQNRSTEGYRLLFTEDFQFAFIMTWHGKRSN